jgi:hypothetical protein
MHDAETREPFGHLGREVGRTVVRHAGAGESPLLEGLRQSVHHVRGVLGHEPLQMAGEARAVIESADKHGLRPLAPCGQHRS